VTEQKSLRAHLDSLASQADESLPRRYALKPLPTEQPSLYRRARRAVGRLLRRLGLRADVPLEPWLAGLSHMPAPADAQPLLIWAIGCDAETLHSACRELERRLRGSTHFSPVLVTDVADFTFFSRLGWLVEYVPTLDVPGGDYAYRKQRYLAWRYRGAPALPVRAAFSDIDIEDLKGD
jgi:hypothetical protein